MVFKKRKHGKRSSSRSSLQDAEKEKREHYVHTLINVFLSALLIIICIAPATFAALPADWADDVVISEVYHSPLAMDTEFIELYNPTNTRINISHWSIWTEDALPTPEAIIPGNTFIEPYSYYLIGDSGYNNGKEDPSWPDADFVNGMHLRSGFQDHRDTGVMLANSDYDIVDALGWGNPAEIMLCHRMVNT